MKAVSVMVLAVAFIAFTSGAIGGADRGVALSQATDLGREAPTNIASLLASS